VQIEIVRKIEFETWTQDTIEQDQIGNAIRG
jgi:hypothetical protein